MGLLHVPVDKPEEVWPLTISPEATRYRIQVGSAGTLYTSHGLQRRLYSSSPSVAEFEVYFAADSLLQSSSSSVDGARPVTRWKTLIMISSSTWDGWALTLRASAERV